MRPAAQHQAVIDILTLFDEKRAPLDRLVHDYFQMRRYAGSKDRRTVRELCFAVMRHRALYEKALHPHLVDGRTLLICHLAYHDSGSLNSWTGENHSPQPLNPQELNCASAMSKISADAVQRPNVPTELLQFLEDNLGEDADNILCSMSSRACLDLRVHPLKIHRDQALRLLQQEGVEAVSTPYSPYGIRLQKPVALDQHPLMLQGAIEVQDEGSQLIALLAAPKPGDVVIDYCAGAGGKTLAISALMRGKGNLIACDVSPRIKQLLPRLKRAQIDHVQTFQLPNLQLERYQQKADVVLVDAPCSGMGTWRRAPDLPWRQSIDDIKAMPEVQLDILAKASAYVRPGGVLVYATCSLLKLENEDVVSEFLAHHSRFSLQPAANLGEMWAQVADSTGEFLKVSPYSHGCDGFFAACFIAC